MKRISRNLLLLSVGLLMATSAMAFDNPLAEQIDRAYDPTGGIRKMQRATPELQELPPVPLPMPIEPGFLSSATPTQPGKADVSMGSAGAMVAARGAAMATPQQRADMQIRRLIRNLY